MSEVTVPDLKLPNGTVIPAETVRQFLWGDVASGLRWIEALPDVLTEWCARERVTLSPALPGLSMNLVLFGGSERHGPVVIKTSPPHAEGRAEIAALRVHSSPNIVEVIDADDSVSIMLQRRILPGTTLRSEVEAGNLTERAAAEIGARLLQEYWVTPPDDAAFFPLERWFKALFDYWDKYPTGGGRIPHEHVLMAISVAEDALGTQRDQVTLHGDLHHDNILLDKDQGWTVIDPKGLVGERGYDIAHWLINPVGVDQRPDLPQLTSDRLDWFSELLGIDRFRLWQWAMPHSVLSDCWNLEMDEHGPVYARAIADSLFAMPEARAYW